MGLKSIMVIAFLVIVGSIVFSLLKNKSTPDAVPFVDFSQSNDPVFMVRTILAESSKWNTNTVWERGSISEPTPIDAILETQASWDFVYENIRILLKISDSEMQTVWQSLLAEKSVGEWETVIAEYTDLVEELTTIKIPLASMIETGEYGPFGCGAHLNFHPVQISQTNQVLNAVYTELFSLPYEAVEGSNDKNIIASQKNLDFENVTMENGGAYVYLSGVVIGNHCADELFRKQIEQAAFQFDNVQSISVYVNNTIFDWCSLSDADPEESGCDINPKPWITKK